MQGGKGNCQLDAELKPLIWAFVGTVLESN